MKALKKSVMAFFLVPLGNVAMAQDMASVSYYNFANEKQYGELIAQRFSVGMNGHEDMTAVYSDLIPVPSGGSEARVMLSQYPFSAVQYDAVEVTSFVGTPSPSVDQYRLDWSDNSLNVGKNGGARLWSINGSADGARAIITERDKILGTSYSF